MKGVDYMNLLKEFLTVTLETILINL